MPRFSFPVPGRRNKQETPPASGPPLTKAQKLLGASQINVDSTVSLSTGDAPKHWDTASNANSNISINISESALSYDESSHDGGLSSLTEDTVVDSPRGGRIAGFDEESGVLPRAFADGDISFDMYGLDGRSITDASSLRRKQSGSTIVSYYDKSKVPLGISQQTSNSAMAKGLPTKASSLLDIDGSISASRRKKKPAKLDLSRMFTNRKSSSTLSTERGLVLGPDMVTRSPSFMSSASPHDFLNRPHSSHRNSDRRVRPATRGSNREDLSGAPSPKQRVLRKKSLPNPRISTTAPAPPTPSATQEAAGLQNLYQHYEQMTFRNVFAEQDESSSDAPATESEDDNAPPMSPKTVPQIYQEKLEEDARAGNYLPQISREVPLYKDISAYLGGYGASVDPAQRGNDPLDLPTLNAPLADCSDSISSRHTRTSKASKRTAPSLLEIDLQQTSVLSLSSDSEDDFVEPRPKTSSTGALPSPQSQRDTTLSQEGHRPPTSRSGGSSGKKKDRSSGRSDNTVHFLSPNDGPSPGPILPATAYSRASSASASTNSTTKPSIRDLRSPSRTESSRTESRISMASTRTGNSVGPANYTVHEARAITLIPAQGASYNSDVVRKNSSSEQLTPPLSPTSMDFMMRSNHTSVYDGDSVRSAGNSFSAESSRSPSTGPGRFMAVTRQEELLLAALRKKRLRMRESIIAEFEEEQELEKLEKAHAEVHAQVQELRKNNSNSNSGNSSGNNSSSSSSNQLAKPVHEIRRSSIDAVLELHAPQPRSMSAASVSFNDFPMHFEDTPFPVPPSAGIRNSLRSSSAMSLSMPLSPRSKPPTAQLPPTPTAKSTPNADLDRVLMNLNNAKAVSNSTASGKASNSSGSGSGITSGSGGSNSTPASDRSEDIFGGAVRNGNLDRESSPRLSDCLDFDDVSEEQEGEGQEDVDDGAASESVESYDSFNFQTPADQSPIDPPAATSSSQQLNQGRRQSVFGQQQFLGVAKTTPGQTSLSTVHDDFDEFGDYDDVDDVDVSDMDMDDDFSVHNSGDQHTSLPFDHFGGNNNIQTTHVSYNKNSHNSFYGNSGNQGQEDEEQGIPRPDSPLESPLPFPHKRAVRISAVGGGTRVGMEAGWWGHNG